MGFAEAVCEVCRPAYRDSGVGGCPGLDPEGSFKMHMIGFFENLLSEFPLNTTKKGRIMT